MTCGAALSDIAPQRTTSSTFSETRDYDFQFGESDLYEGALRRVGHSYLMGAALFLVMIMFGGLILVFGPSLASRLSSDDNPNNTGGNGVLIVTPRPTLAFATVTAGPPTLTPSNTVIPSPTATSTPTREPCMQQVQPGEGLYAVVARCGHLSFDVLEMVIATNNLPDANSIQEGQILEIPWPTETPDPNVIVTESSNDQQTSNDGGEFTVASAFDESFDPSFIPTSTLQPGIQFHTVQKDETVIVIGLTYGATVEILSQLNPEITFSQCDFGENFGGPRCSVPLIEGQVIRVPAPTPTPTIPPTASGSETPTPTPTATFNAPSARRPSNRAFFRKNDLITLRWIPSGTLGNNQAYLIRLEDLTAGIVYTATTVNTSFVVQEAWQGESGSTHEYAWSVSVIDIDDPEHPYYVSETLTFTWEGQA
jgi:hypothetical protein